MKLIIFSSLTILHLLVLVSCSQIMQATSQNHLELTELGKNLRGEECQLESGTIVHETYFEAKRVLNVKCGDWEWPSARIFEVVSKEDTLDSWFQNDREWTNTLSRRMHCDLEPQRLKYLKGYDQFQLTCQLNNGGWPYVALAIKINNVFYLADGIPAALPSIERSIAKMAGITDEIKTSPESPAVQFLKDQLKGRIYAAAELQQYYQAMTMGQYYNGIKEFSKAKNQYQNALDIHEKRLGRDNNEIGDALIHLALELSNQEQFSFADEHFRRAKEKINQKDSAGDYIRSVSYQALHLANQGQFENALNQARKARTERKGYAKKNNVSYGHESSENTKIEFKELGSSVFSIEKEELTPVETAHSLYIEAAMLQQQGQLPESDQTLREAQRVLSLAQEPPPLWEPQMDGLSGVVKESQEQLAEAKQSRDMSLNKFEKRAPRKRPSALAYLDFGKSLLQENQVEDALENFRQAINLASRGNNSFRLYQLEPYFEALLEKNQYSTETKEANYREAFNAAQLVKSGKITRDIARTVTRLGERDDDVGQLISDLQRKQLLRLRKQQEYQAELQRVLDQTHQVRLEKLGLELDQIDQNIQDLESAMQLVNPEYLQLLGAPVKIDKVIEVLDDDEGMLQILIGKTKSFVFFVQKGQVSAYSVRITENEIAQTVDRIREGILSRKGVSLVPAFVIEKAHRLFDALLKPIAKQLKDVEHLVVVPSGPLLSFPFGLFVTQLPSVDKRHADYFSNVQWLARQTSISLVPSAQSSVYLRQHVKSSDAPNPFVAFGDFVADSKADPAQRSNRVSICQTDSKEIRKNYVSLPSTRKEIAAVAGLFPQVSNDDLFLNDEFTERAVKANTQLKNYSIVYFATHAVLPDENECHFEPSLVTSLNASDSGKDNGFLTSSEILELDMDADLVVLSACDTGGAEKSGGESLSGLARSFFFAGARKLLVSHWSVDDEATADLMIRVFKNLKSDKQISITKALKKGQIEMMDNPSEKKWSNPYYWAAFTLVGDGAQSVSGF